MLTPTERERTRVELVRELAVSGWSAARVATALDMPEARVLAALAVTDALPGDVWAVRDLLAAVIGGEGGVPGTYTHLGEGARSAADGWFSLRTKAQIDEAVHRGRAT